MALFYDKDQIINGCTPMMHLSVNRGDTLQTQGTHQILLGTIRIWGVTTCRSKSFFFQVMQKFTSGFIFTAAVLTRVMPQTTSLPRVSFFLKFVQTMVTSVFYTSDMKHLQLFKE